MSLAIDTSGNILAGGFFVTYQGSTVNRIARLTPTGALDTTFATGGGFASIVDSLVVTSTGAVVVGGAFTTHQGVTTRAVARLTSTGALDTTLAIGTGFPGTVYSVVIENSGTVLVGGNFATYQGTAAPGLVRLSAPASLVYDLNGGTGTAPPTHTGLIGRAVTVAPGTGLTRVGYTFAGWNTAADGSGTATTAGTSYTLTGIGTLYAQWTAIQSPNTDGPGTTAGTGSSTTGTLATTGNDNAVPLTAVGALLLLAGTVALVTGHRRQH